MTKSRFIPFAAVALLAVAYVPAHAQSTHQVQLAFGYECGDRFLVRNDGNEPVVIEYAVAGSQDKSQLHLDAKQSSEIASAQSGNLELSVSGKVVASEPKGNRACRAAAQNNGDVTVRPLDQSADNTTTDTEAVAPGYTAAPVVVYAGPNYYPYGYYPYDYYPYDYYPSYYGYGYPSIGFYGRVGGYGRGFVGGRSGGGRVGGGRSGGHGGHR